jgi:hypothetical protein
MEIRFFNTLKGFSKLLVSSALMMLLVFAAFSCKKTEKLPAGVLSKEKMVVLLTDFYITEEKVNRLNLQPDSGSALFAAMKEKVFEKTGVPDSVFSRSFDYYMDHPTDLELIYTALVDSLQLKEQRTAR